MEDITGDMDRLTYIGTLASGLAHEIRNPLNALNINVQLLEEDLQRPEVNREEALELIRDVKNEIIRLEEILTEFLRFAKPPELQLEEEDINSVVDEVLRFIGPETERQGIIIEREFQSDLPPLKLDKKLFKQALFNLILNANQAMAEGGKLKVRTRLLDGQVQIEVCDAGPGIPGDIRDNIFDLFFSTKEDGTGLGLSITQRIVKEHKGTIEVSSLNGKGAIFSMKLPLEIKKRGTDVTTEEGTRSR